jgi:NitT/TauT family transport system permease protein
MVPAGLQTEPPVERTRKGRGALVRALVGLLTVGLVVTAWWAAVVIGNYPPFILPTPLAVAERTWEMLADGSLLLHWGTTLLEAGIGFLLALVVGIGLGYMVAKSRLVERVVSPYIGLSQGLPVVALAPLLTIWFSEDLLRKVVIVALICFIPMLVNTVVALRGIDRSMYEVARISGASWWQTVRYVELPLGARPLLGGIKLALTLSVTGAIVGEFVTSDSGLGFLLMLGRGTFRTTDVFVGLVNLALLTMLLYGAVSLLERRVEGWE